MRFLEIAKELGKPTAVITDNDGDYDSKITKKYIDYADCKFISIFADQNESFNTLEPQIVNANKEQPSLLRSVLGVTEEECPDEPSLSVYMQKNKTESALSVFSSEETVVFPTYISEAVNWAYGK